MSDREAGQSRVSQPSHGHQTALHRAAMVGNRSVIDGLIKGGCALDLQNKDGNTALHEVSWHGFCQSVKLLVKAGADVNARNKAGNTALHLACQNAHVHSAHVLLCGGSSPDIRNNVGDTCLHVAARYNHLAVIKILVCSLCSVTEKNQQGDTALHVAASLNHKETVQFLLETGINGNARNHEGKTALDKARDFNYIEMAYQLAKDPQIHRFIRGRTVRKRRDRLKAERRTHPVTREEIRKDSGSMAEAWHSSERVASRTSLNQAGIYHDHPDQTSVTPTRPYHRKQMPLKQSLKDTTLRRQNGHTNLNSSRLHPYDDEVTPTHLLGKTYQLYTLYRDEDGTLKQAPANVCHCKPLIKRLEGELNVTREEVRTQMLLVQKQVNTRLEKIDCKSKHQMELVDMLSQERVVAERLDCLHRMDQRAARGKTEAQRRRVAVTHELKRWCMTQFRDMDLHLPADGQHYTLLPSPPAEKCVGYDEDSECIPLLFSEESSSSLANYVKMLPCPSWSDPHYATQSGEMEKHQGLSAKYFELKLDTSPVPGFGFDYWNTAVHHLPQYNHDPGLLLTSTATQWQHPQMNDSHMGASIQGPGREGCSSSIISSSSQSSISDWDHIPHSHGGHHRRQLRGRITTHGMMGQPNDRTKRAEFFEDTPPEPTFCQARNKLHAMEVTQQFFETVSAQLERWYERKFQDSRWQAEHRAQQDRTQLLQRIRSLEEELEQLRMINGSNRNNGSKDS